MNKLKLLKISVVILIIINVILISVVYIGSSRHPKRHNEKQIIIDRLELKNDQIDLFEHSIEEHIKTIRIQEERLNELKKELYLTLKSDESIKEEELLKELRLVKNEIELIHLKHFKDIKNLCTEEQLPKYNKLTEELARIFAPHPSRPKR